MSLVPGSGESSSPFDAIRKYTDAGQEYWTARELQVLLSYDTWRRFEDAINRAKTSCQQFGQTVEDHFVSIGKMVQIGSGAMREQQDYALSRYAVYLIAQNGDPSKSEIATAQAYFAVQTRRQEVRDQIDPADLRIKLRQKVAEQNKSLASMATRAGVTHHGLFQDNGYRGLYGGRGIRDIHVYKEIPLKENLLDRVGSTELAANLFRITQCEERLEREGACGQAIANQIHAESGRTVRDAIRKQGNTLPEDLPTEPHIRKLISAKKKARKQLPKGDS